MRVRATLSGDHKNIFTIKSGPTCRGGIEMFVGVVRGCAEAVSLDLFPIGSENRNLLSYPDEVILVAVVVLDSENQRLFRCLFIHGEVKDIIFKYGSVGKSGLNLQVREIRLRNNPLEVDHLVLFIYTSLQHSRAVSPGVDNPDRGDLGVIRLLNLARQFFLTGDKA